MITDGVTNVEPDTILVSLYDPLDNPILTNQSMTQLSTGRYLRSYNTSISSNGGNWRWVVIITKDSNTITKDVYTRLVGGPFDVRDITIVDNSITTLGIRVTIENTGELSQDAYIQWNLTRTDNGVSLKEGLDTVLIPANSEVAHTVNPSNITYLGDVRITFIVTYSGTEKAAAYEEFTTVEEVDEPPPRPPGGGDGDDDAGGGAVAGLPPSAPEIEISKYPDEIVTEVGWTQYPSVTVNNTGKATLHNIKLVLEGIPDSWYGVTPRLIPLLGAGDSETFVVNILVPPGTEAKQYYGSFNVTTDETSDSKLTSVIVFGSREELVQYQLDKLKNEFEDFQEDVDAAEQLGEKDITRVLDIVDEIQHQIDLTEGYLTAKLFDEALGSVTTGWRLLDRGRELLRDAPSLRPMTVLAIPDWLLTLLLILLIVALALFIALNRYKKKLDKVFKFRQQTQQKPVTEDIIGGGPSVEKREEEEAELARKQAEKAKLEKVTNLLEKEYKEGIISEKAYNELRQRNMEKIKQLGV